MLSKTQVVLSYGQQRLWTLDQVDGPSATYNMPSVLHLHGKVDHSALKKAIQAIIERHESLRTFIEANENDLLNGFLLDPPKLDEVISIINLQTLHEQDPAACNEQVEALLKAEAAKPFDLGRDYALRSQLIVLGEQHAILSLTLHHHAGDETSIGILAHELDLAYRAFLQNQVPAWQPLPIQYSDWAAW